jgi:hypothetical protein
MLYIAGGQHEARGAGGVWNALTAVAAAVEEEEPVPAEFVHTPAAYQSLPERSAPPPLRVVCRGNVGVI